MNRAARKITANSANRVETIVDGFGQEHLDLEDEDGRAPRHADGQQQRRQEACRPVGGGEPGGGRAHRSTPVRSMPRSISRTSVTLAKYSGASLVLMSRG